MAMLCVLGPPAVRVADELTPLRLRPKALAMLVRLALGGPLNRAVLAELIFPEAESPRAALRWHLSYLRDRLPDSIRTALAVTSEDVAFDAPNDVALFQSGAERLLQQPGEPDAADLLSLYRGDLCAGLTVSASAVFDTWLYIQQERLRRQFRQATVAVARHVLGTGRAAAVIEPLSQLVAVDPYFEDGHMLLIDACEALDRHAAATSAYARYQRILREELQTEPPRAFIARYEPGVRAERVPPRDNLVSLSRLTLHVVDWPGDEPAIFSIHGSTMSAHTFTALAERLTPDIRFVAVDLRGHGFSDKPPGGYSLADHVEDLRELVSVMGLRRPVLLGFSMGGAIAAFLASHVEHSGLILLDGVVGDRAFTQNAAALVVPPQRATLEARVGGFDEYLSHWRSNMMTEGWSDEAERILERTIRYELAPLADGRYRRRTLMAAFEETWAAVLESDSLAALRKVRSPTLIVQATRPWIEGRPYVTDDIVAAQRNAVPHAALFVASHSTHPMLARAPEAEMVERIREFVGSISLRS
jgi:pimeloyl-ACP methyl ester carboxylesterase/DNA-binding SARP family transcriptional activator